MHTHTHTHTPHTHTHIKLFMVCVYTALQKATNDTLTKVEVHEHVCFN